MSIELIVSILLNKYGDSLLLTAPFGIAIANRSKLLWYNRQFCVDIAESFECTDLRYYLEYQCFVDLEQKIDEILANPDPTLGHDRVPIKTRSGRIFEFCLKRIYRDEGEIITSDTIAIYCFSSRNIGIAHDKLMIAQNMSILGKLSIRAAHDINNLCTAVLGFSDSILSRHRVNEQTFVDATSIKRAISKSCTLVNQLIMFGRQRKQETEVVSVNDMINNMIPLARKLVGGNIGFRILQGPSLYRVKTNCTQLEQMLLNLIINSKDAMPDGGIITIKTYSFDLASEIRIDDNVVKSGKYLSIEVVDNGCGIDEIRLCNIFDPFFSTKIRGTGLGLATVKEFIQRNGGVITVKSQVGIGTTFVIYLPLHSQDSANDPTSIFRVKPNAKPSTILVSEDDEDIRMIISRALTAYGHKVIEAMSGKMAMDIIDLEYNNISLLISDMIMPDMEGTDVASYCLQKNKEVKLIFISGHVESVIQQHNMLISNARFVQKPFDVMTFVATVNSLLLE